LKQTYEQKQRRWGGIMDDSVEVLSKVEALLHTHLRDKYGIIEITQ